MSMLKKLLNSSHPALNKDPKADAGIQITATQNTAVVVRDGYIQVEGQGNYQLSSYTVSSLASAMTSGTVTATAVGNTGLSALTLIEGVYATPCEIQVFTSPLWQIYTPVAQQFKQSKQAATQMVFQAKTDTASGMWLDQLGELYQVTREPGEPDELYAIRVIDFSLSVRVNNIAIEKIMNDLGYQAKVDDTTQYNFEVKITLPTSPPQGYVYSVASLSDLVNLLKAAGTVATVVLSGSLSDTTRASDTISNTLTSNAAWTWANFPGKNGWVGFTW